FYTIVIRSPPQSTLFPYTTLFRSIKDMMNTLRYYFARTKAGDFSRFSRTYRVYMMADFDYRTDPESLSSIYVRNKDGGMVPVSTLVSLNPIIGPETITRYNLYNAISVNADPASGYSTGDVMEAIEKLAIEKMPVNY